MTRRNFFKQICVALAAALLPVRRGGAVSAPAKVRLFACHVAGFQFHRGPEMIRRLRPGDTLELRREPDNPHDSLAIAVVAAGERLGYLPRSINAIPAAHMDEGRRLSATVEAAEPGLPPWQMLEIVVEMEVG